MVATPGGILAHFLSLSLSYLPGKRQSVLSLVHDRQDLHDCGRCVRSPGLGRRVYPELEHICVVRVEVVVVFIHGQHTKLVGRAWNMTPKSVD